MISEFHGERFGKLLEEQGITRKEAMKALGVRRETLWRWISGQVQPTATNIDAIERSLGIPREVIVKTVAVDPYKAEEPSKAKGTASELIDRAEQALEGGDLAPSRKPSPREAWRLLIAAERLTVTGEQRFDIHILKTRCYVDRGLFGPGIERAREASRHAVGPVNRARCLNNIGACHLGLGHWEEAKACADRSVHILEGTESAEAHRRRGYAHWLWGKALLDEFRYGLATDLGDRALDHFRQADDGFAAGGSEAHRHWSMTFWGLAEVFAGIPAGEERIKEAKEWGEQAGDWQVKGFAHLWLGTALREQGKRYNGHLNFAKKIARKHEEVELLAESACLEARSYLEDEEDGMPYSKREWEEVMAPARKHMDYVKDYPALDLAREIVDRRIKEILMERYAESEDSSGPSVTTMVMLMMVGVLSVLLTYATPASAAADWSADGAAATMGTVTLTHGVAAGGGKGDVTAYGGGGKGDVTGDGGGKGDITGDGGGKGDVTGDGGGKGDITV